jgi:hypothetical protein
MWVVLYNSKWTIYDPEWTVREIHGPFQHRGTMYSFIRHKFGGGTHCRIFKLRQI